MKKPERHLHEKLKKQEDNNALRKLKPESNLKDFSSNDYLGLAAVPDIHFFNHADVSNYGATGSRLLSGNNSFILQTEEFLANHHQAEASLLFPSGYTANIGLLSAIPHRSDTLIYDELSHASIRDGVRLSYASSFSFRHNDTGDLKEKLSRVKGQAYVVVESVYSMDGDLAPLRELSQICNEFDAGLIVDEAHAVGVFGENGGGLVQKLGLQHEVTARVITFGKAMGGHGASVLGSKTLINYLLNFSRPFIYTTGLPIHSVHAIKNSYEFMLNNPARQNDLWNNIELFKSEFKNLTVNDSPVQRIIIPGNTEVKEAAATIQDQGFLVYPILSPTVPKGKERLRVSIHSFNKPEDIKELSALIKNLL